MLHPNFDPIALDLGFLKVRWYGIMYVLGFVAAYWLLLKRIKTMPTMPMMNKDTLSDLLMYGGLGVVLGGRLGYMVLYQLGEFLANPASILAMSQGGMSFHGGFLGVVIAMALFARKHKIHAFDLLDFIAPAVPIGLGLGRIGNFINGELVGRVSYGGIQMYFPQALNMDNTLLATDPSLQALAKNTIYGTLLPRHPSQLYQAFFEGLVLFVILWLFSQKPRPRMAISALFLIGYGCGRFITEFFREPDAGYALFFGVLSKGQLYSLPMILVGVVMMYLAYQSSARHG